MRSVSNLARLYYDEVWDDRSIIQTVKQERNKNEIAQQEFIEEWRVAGGNVNGIDRMLETVGARAGGSR